jgi:hypothetical protein
LFQGFEGGVGDAAEGGFVKHVVMIREEGGGRAGPTG